jgi:hypothetical protein
VGVLAKTARSLSHVVGCVGVVVAAQTLVFLSAAPLSNRPLAWTADSMLLNVTAPGLRQQQVSLSAALQAIRSQFDPLDTLVLTVTDQDPYRFMMYYLPEYQVLRLDPHAHSVLASRGWRQSNWREAAGCISDSAGVHNAVWVLSSTSEPGLSPSDAKLVSGADHGPFQVWAERTGAGEPEYLGFKFGGQCDALEVPSPLDRAGAT